MARNSKIAIIVAAIAISSLFAIASSWKHELEGQSNEAEIVGNSSSHQWKVDGTTYSVVAEWQSSEYGGDLRIAVESDHGRGRKTQIEHKWSEQNDASGTWDHSVSFFKAANDSRHRYLLHRWRAANISRAVLYQIGDEINVIRKFGAFKSEIEFSYRVSNGDVIELCAVSTKRDSQSEEVRDRKIVELVKF